MAAERERADMQAPQPEMQENPGRLVLVDETSVQTNMTPLRGNVSWIKAGGNDRQFKAPAPNRLWVSDFTGNPPGN